MKHNTTLLQMGLIVLCSVIFTLPSYADEAKYLMLPIQDLAWISYKPNDNIESVVAHCNRVYKTSLASMAYTGENFYVGGDKTRAMSWIISFDFDDRKKLNGISYTHTKLEKEGAIQKRCYRNLHRI